MQFLVVTGNIDHWNPLYRDFVLCHKRIIATGSNQIFAEWLDHVYQACFDEHVQKRLPRMVDKAHGHWYVVRDDYQGKKEFEDWVSAYITRPDCYLSPECVDAKKKILEVLSAS